MSLETGTGDAECEVAHVVPVTGKGLDQVGNAIPLCRTHHWAFDRHLWAIDPTTRRIVVVLKWRKHPALRKILAPPHGGTGSRTTLREGPPFDGTVLKAILAPDDSSSGYATFLVSTDANQAFSVGNVPAGSYFLQLDTPIQGCVCAGFTVNAVFRSFIELIKSFARGTGPEGNEMVAVNVRCLDGFEPEQFQVKRFDGRSH